MALPGTLHRPRRRPPVALAFVLLAVSLPPGHLFGGPGRPEGVAPAPSALGEADQPLYTISRTRERRDLLVASLRAGLEPGERGIFLVTGAPENDLDEFRQKRDFLYLTGLEVPGASLLIVFDRERLLRERLYLPPRDPGRERWVGTSLGPGGADPDSLLPDAERRRTEALTGLRGADGVPGSGIGEAAELGPDLAAAAGAGPAVVFTPEPPAGEGKPPVGDAALSLQMLRTAGGSRLASARNALAGLRSVKSPEEIASIRRASEITCGALRDAMRAARPGMREYEIEAVVEYAFTRAGARFSAFPAIVGAGPNACVLHYSRNDGPIRGGDLILVDAGAEFGRYASDVTRTFPASGRFDAAQRKIYRAVLRAQSEAQALVRPGATIREIHGRVVKVLEEEGLKEGVQHGCCHHVGLDVHDAGSQDAPLSEGMVLTVEPGVYLPEKGIGIRIEDTYLVTSAGYEKLSACVPSDPDAIEALMARPAEAKSGAGTGGGS